MNVGGSLFVEDADSFFLHFRCALAEKVGDFLNLGRKVNLCGRDVKGFLLNCWGDA
jgi:hypothetical protein